MDCYRPLRIRNQYTGKWLHVNCRGCNACLVKAANKKAQELSVTLRHYKYKYFITLTYDNDHVPYIYEDMDGFIFRGQGDNTEQIDSFDSLIDWSVNYRKLTNHCYEKAIGVLYYYDLQCFLKRFRKYINKHYGRLLWKYFAVGEYGTNYARPHFHIVIMSDELLFDECQSACFACWCYHDWHRFWKADEKGYYVNEGCKPVTESCAGYISSYINCNSRNVPISLYKPFLQKTVRSKNIAFGLDAQVLEEYKKDVVRLSSNMVQEGNRRFFYRWLSNEHDKSVSLKLLPSRYIYTFFHRFKGFSEMDFGTKLSCATNIVGICAKAERYGIRLNDIDFVDRSPSGIIHRRYDLKSDDLSFYRSYKRFCIWFGYYCISDYLILMDKVINCYKSNLLYEQMKEYEVLGKQQYLLSLIDTEVEHPEKRLFKLRIKGVNKCLLRGDSVVCPPLVRDRLNSYVYTYKKRLLPKHLNDLNNIFTYY